MDPRIKALYDEAGRLYERAKGIMGEFEGKEMPQEKANEVNTLLDQVEGKTAQAKQLERAAGIGAELSQPANRLGASTATGESAKTDGQQAEVKAAYCKFLSAGPAALTHGEIDLLAKHGARVNGAEIKALSAGDDQAGGYLVLNQFRTELLTKQRESSAMRRIARVLPPIAGGSSITPTVDNELSDAEWTAEIATGSNDTVKPFGRRALTPHPLAKRVKVSNTLLRSAGVDVEGWVRDAMAYKFAVPEENGFINGNGNNQPLGLLNTGGLTSLTTATSLQVFGDDVINWVYGLPASYLANARILCNRAFIRKIRQLSKPSTTPQFDNYIWQPGLQAGSPDTILGVPYELSDRFDDGLDGSDAWEANKIVAVIGDFRFFWIVDSLSLTIQRLVELYAETNETGFIGRKETDGMAVLAEAFYGLKIKA